MPTSSTSLPDDVETLREIIVQQQAQLEDKSEQISTLEEYIRLLKRQRFGTSSERASIDQLGLFNEAEATDGAEDDSAVDDAPETAVAAHTRKKRGRKPLPDVLPRVEIVHDLAEDEKICAHDGHALEEIGREVSEQLEIIPATIQVLRHIRPKYACPRCKTGIKIAPVPPQPIPKSLASPGLLAHVAVSKYVDALPLYRQEAMLGRLGIDLPRATLANWMVKAGQLVVPLVNLIREQLLAGDYVQCDETRFQVLKEPGKRAQSQSYLWVQRGGTEAHPLLLYDYDPSRSGEVPKRLLEGFEGFLQTDGYEGYTAIGSMGGVVHVGCWAHARRKFDEALRVQGKNKKKGAKRSKKHSKAEQGLRFIGKLYRIERETAALSADGAASHPPGALPPDPRPASHLARCIGGVGTAAESDRQGVELPRQAVAEAGALPRRRAAKDGHEPRGKRDSPVRRRPQELALRRHSARRRIEREPVQRHRDREGERDRALRVPAPCLCRAAEGDDAGTRRSAPTRPRRPRTDPDCQPVDRTQLLDRLRSDRRKPSAWRSGNLKTSRSINAVSIA